MTETSKDGKRSESEFYDEAFIEKSSLNTLKTLGGKQVEERTENNHEWNAQVFYSSARSPAKISADGKKLS